MGEFAQLVEVVRDADAYDPEWERLVDLHITAGLWELFGWFDPETRPILNTSVNQTLPAFGRRNP